MNKFTYNLDTFYNETAITYYLLGAFMTDGCIYISKDRPGRKTVTLTSKDKDWLEIINQYICPEKYLLRHGKNCYRLSYYSSELANWFISKGCGERKSLTLQFPTIPSEYLIDFIRGCWDGDGSLSFTKSGNKGTSYQRQAHLTSGSLSFCQSISKELNNIGIKCKVLSHKTKNRKIENRTLLAGESWRVVLSGGESVYNLSKLLYEPYRLAMPRKQQLAQLIIDDWEKISTCKSCSSSFKPHKLGKKRKYCFNCVP